MASGWTPTQKTGGLRFSKRAIANGSSRRPPKSATASGGLARRRGHRPPTRRRLLEPIHGCVLATFAHDAYRPGYGPSQPTLAATEPPIGLALRLRSGRRRWRGAAERERRGASPRYRKSSMLIQGEARLDITAPDASFRVHVQLGEAEAQRRAVIATKQP